MPHRPDSPRIVPLAEDELTPDAEELLSASLLPEANIFRTLVRAPGLFRKWLPFGGKLLNGKILPRERELLILRTACNCRCDYEWAQHVGLAMRAGLAELEIELVARRSLEGWGDFDAALLTAADELHEDSHVSDATWEVLAERYETQQLIELPMLVGHYHLVAMTLNSLRVKLDEGLVGIPRPAPNGGTTPAC